MFWIITSILLLALSGFLFTVTWTDRHEQDRNGRKWAALPMATWLLLSAVMSFHYVPDGHLGLIKTFNRYTGTQDAWWHAKAPFQSVVVVPGNTRKTCVYAPANSHLILLAPDGE